MGLSTSTKAQTWYMDFAIALLLFTFTLVVYFSYTNNFQKQEKGNLDAMVKDAKSISSSLVLSGYPSDWKNETAIRIGIADEQQLNATKVKEFKRMDYNRTRMIFATPYNYFVFFINQNGEVLNVNTVCGIGHPIVETKYIGKSAYYYSSETDKFLKNFMNETFSSDIYFGDNPTDLNDIDALMSNISKYAIIVFEHPDISPSNFNAFKAKVDNFTSNGSLTMISGQLTSAQGQNLVGVDFYKKSGQATTDRNSTVNNTDIYLSLTVGQNIVFKQAYYVENTSSSFGFKQISTFNADGRNALSRWQYGSGTAYFFSDFDTSFFSGDFVEVVEDAAKSLISGICTDVNATIANPKNLAKTERYLNYNSEVIRMVVYVWE